MASRKPEDLLKRADKAIQMRDLNRSMYEDAYEYLLPYRNTFNTQNSQSGTINRPTKTFDSTGCIAANNFVNTLQANFAPVFQRWAEIKAGPGMDEELREQAQEPLDKITKTVFAYIHSSNFGTAFAEMAFDWGIGTGAMWIFEGDESQPINCIATPISQYGLEEGTFGDIGAIYKDLEMAAELIEPTYRQFGVKLPQQLSDQARTDPTSKVKLMECLYKDMATFEWRYEVIHVATKEVIAKRKYREAICLTPRWMKVPGFPYGVGPLLFAMPDVKTLNKVSELFLQNLAMTVFGAYTVASNGAFNANTAIIRPGSFIPVERNGGPNGPSIAALPVSGNFQVQEFFMEYMRDNIKKVMLDNRLPDDKGSPKTAYEIAQRLKDFSTDIGAAYGRAIREFVNPFFRRVIEILERKGLLKLPPGFNIDNFLLRIQVISPVAQTQAMADVQRFFENFSMVSNISPELAMMSYDVEKIPQYLQDTLGGPPELLRDQGEKAQLQQVVGQILANMQAQQQQPQGAPQQ